MNKTVHLALAATFSALSACAAVQSVIGTPTQTTEEACASVGTALQTLTLFRSSLSTSEIATVNAAVGFTTPICTQPSVPTLSSDQEAALQSAVSALTGLASKVAPTPIPLTPSTVN